MNSSDNLPPNENPLYTEPFPLGSMQIRPLDLLEHVLTTGGTGSGKTRSLVMPLVEQVLSRFGTGPSQKAGMIIIDAKGDMVELAKTCVARAGRSDDLYILGESGNCWFSIFDQFEGDYVAVANFLFETLEDRGPRQKFTDSSFWNENALRLLQASVICAKARHGMELGGFDGISWGIKTITSLRPTSSDDSEDSTEALEWDPADTWDAGQEEDLPDEESAEEATSTKERLTRLKAIIHTGVANARIGTDEAMHLTSYVNEDFLKGSPQTWGTISNMARNYISQFGHTQLKSLFQESHGTRKICPEDIIDRGLLLIVSLSPVLYGEAAAPFRLAIKKACCTRILQRDHLVLNDGKATRKINQERPILYVMDEFHTTLTSRGISSDVHFIDRAREFRCACILATQGISALRSAVENEGTRNHLLNNCRTKFFFANDCPDTLQYFEFIGGTEDRVVAGVTYAPKAAPARFRLPNHTFTSARKTSLASLNIENRKQPRFSASNLGALPNGTAYVVKKGRALELYTADPKHYGR